MSAFAVLEKTLTIPRTANASKVFFNCKNVGISMLLREKDLNLQGPIGLEDGLLQPGLVGKSVAGQVRARTLQARQTLSVGTRVTNLRWQDRKSTRLNSSHSQISYGVFCLKKKKK